MHVLIIKTSALGDIIHALPVLDYLHKASPGIVIDWVVEEGFKELLEGNQLLNQLHLLRSRRWRKSPFTSQTRREVADFWRELRRNHYDIVFDIQGNLKSGLLDLASGAEQSIGFPGELLQERINSLFTTKKAQFSVSNDHATLRCLSVVSTPYDLPYHNGEFSTDIAFSNDKAAEAADIISEMGPGLKILFHCGTTWQTKFWNPEGWSELGTRICSNFPGSVILFTWGNEPEKSAATVIASQITGQTRLVRRLPLKTLAALFKHVSLVVGGDTGPVHLAAAVGTPTVSLYRSSDGSESGPRGKSHVIVQSPLSCTRCFKTSCSRDSECRSSITVDAMFAGVLRLLTARNSS
jgi:heptosyltransferase-1